MYEDGEIYVLAEGYRPKGYKVRKCNGVGISDHDTCQYTCRIYFAAELRLSWPLEPGLNWADKVSFLRRHICPSPLHTSFLSPCLFIHTPTCNDLLESARENRSSERYFSNVGWSLRFKPRPIWTGSRPFSYPCTWHLGTPFPHPFLHSVSKMLSNSIPGLDPTSSIKMKRFSSMTLYFCLFMASYILLILTFTHFSNARSTASIVRRMLTPTGKAEHDPPFFFFFQLRKCT